MVALTNRPPNQMSCPKTSELIKATPKSVAQYVGKRREKQRKTKWATERHFSRVLKMTMPDMTKKSYTA
jgi:hypothetical protein